jgi:hypothetical protein
MAIVKSTTPSPLSVHRQCISVSSSGKFLSFVISVALLVWVGIQLGFRPVGAPAPATTLASRSHLWTLEQTHAKLKKMRLSPIFDAKTTTDPWKTELFQRLDRIRVVCGLLCQLNTVDDLQKHTTEVPGSVFPMIRVKPVNCPAILGMQDIDAADNSTPPFPDELKRFYTLNGAIEITGHERRQDIALGISEATVWTKKAVDQTMAEAKNGTLHGTYGVAAATTLFERYGCGPAHSRQICNGHWKSYPLD